MPSSLDLTPSWESIEAKIAAIMPAVTIRPNGVLDDETVPMFPSNGGIKPFAIVWFRGLRRSPSVRSVAGTRLDGYATGFDLAIIANNGSDAVRLMNVATDGLLGFKPTNGGEITKGTSAYDGARAVETSEGRPNRFVAMETFNYQFMQHIQA